MCFADKNSPLNFVISYTYISMIFFHIYLQFHMTISKNNMTLIILSAYDCVNFTTRLGRCHFSGARRVMHCYRRMFVGLSDDDFDQISDSAINKLYR